MSVVTVRIPDSVDKALEKLCLQEDRNKSWFLKKGLEMLMEDMADYYKSEEEYRKFITNKDKGVDFADLAKEVGIKLKNYKKKKA